VDDRCYNKHEYHTLSSEQKNNLCIKRIKRGHVGNAQGGGGHRVHDVTINSIQSTIAELGAKFDKFNISDDYYDDSS
jgi:arginyl-tRNA synthetase